eukprot:TRINITY_DN12618_c0_g1_i1.p1 TRINITY_DN12618_c0_g1~~TRINITY_DN12618_c0_g1_i1.p1  ORF type:complete len:634 (+),score=163.99 TRINITY_DN12618_c0_g1_i1:166-2067(+)
MMMRSVPRAADDLLHPPANSSSDGSANKPASAPATPAPSSDPWAASSSELKDRLPIPTQQSSAARRANTPSPAVVAAAASAGVHPDPSQRSPRSSSKPPRRSPSPSPRGSLHDISADSSAVEPLSVRISKLVQLQQKAQQHARQRTDAQKLQIALVLDSAEQVAQILDKNPDLAAEYSPNKLLQLSLPHQPQIMHLALSRGADPNVISKQDNLPALFSAIRVPDAWKTLIQFNADWKVDDGSMNVLQHAIMREEKDLVTALVDAGADLDNADAANGRPPALFFAVSVNSFNSAVHLLELGADPRVVFRGQTLVHAIISNRVFSRADELLEIVFSKGGYECLAQVDGKGLTPFLLAVYMGRPNLVKLLIDHEADLTAADSQGGNALWVLLQSPFAIHVPELIPMLLNAGIAVDDAADNVVSRLASYSSKLQSSGSNRRLAEAYGAALLEFEKLGYGYSSTSSHPAPASSASQPNHHDHEASSSEEVHHQDHRQHHHRPDETTSHVEHQSAGYLYSMYEEHGGEQAQHHHDVGAAGEHGGSEVVYQDGSFSPQENQVDFSGYEDATFDNTLAGVDDGTYTGEQHHHTSTEEAHDYFGGVAKDEHQGQGHDYFANMDHHSDPFASVAGTDMKSSFI